MTKFTEQENAKRREVFSFIRNNKYYYSDSDLKRKFGRSKLVLQSIEEARKRVADGRAAKSEHAGFFERIGSNASELAKCLPSSGYSMGEVKKITNRLYGALGLSDKYDQNMVARYDNTQEYARSSKYSARHGEVRAELPISVLAKGEVMEGMITIRTKQIQKRIWKCQWVVWDYERNKRGFITTEAIVYHLESGYVVERGKSKLFSAGWFHCSTLKDARENLARYIAREKAWAQAQKDAKRREAEEKKAADRKRREQERIDKQERMTVMAHGKNYTQKEVNRAAWVIFGEIAQRKDSCLFHSIYRGYKLDLNENDAFERDVRTAWENICQKHDVIKELSKHNARAKQAKYWSEQPVNILQHQLVKNFGRATGMDESRWSMSLQCNLIYAYSPRDKKIFSILYRMYRRQMATKHEAVAKSAELTDGLQHMYVYRDSIAAGNCVPGTDGFIADHGLKKTDTKSGEFLLRISRGSWQHSNVIRIIEHYMSLAHADFYQHNAGVINSILQTL